MEMLRKKLWNNKGNNGHMKKWNKWRRKAGRWGKKMRGRGGWGGWGRSRGNWPFSGRWGKDTSESDSS